MDTDRDKSKSTDDLPSYERNLDQKQFQELKQQFDPEELPRGIAALEKLRRHAHSIDDLIEKLEEIRLMERELFYDRDEDCTIIECDHENNPIWKAAEEIQWELSQIAQCAEDISTMELKIDEFTRLRPEAD